MQPNQNRKVETSQLGSREMHFLRKINVVAEGQTVQNYTKGRTSENRGLSSGEKFTLGKTK